MSIAATDVDGEAMKNDESGSDEPASEPLDQEVPDEFVCADGTKTWNWPLAFAVRNGCSSVTGLAASTVFCWHCPVKTGAGAPVTPENTLFHRPLGQPFCPPMALLRTRYCW